MFFRAGTIVLLFVLLSFANSTGRPSSGKSQGKEPSVNRVLFRSVYSNENIIVNCSSIIGVQYASILDILMIPRLDFQLLVFKLRKSTFKPK